MKLKLLELLFILLLLFLLLVFLLSLLLVKFQQVTPRNTPDQKKFRKILKNSDKNSENIVKIIWIFPENFSVFFFLLFNILENKINKIQKKILKKMYYFFLF